MPSKQNPRTRLPAPSPDEAEEELALTFLTKFSQFERALPKAGFTKTGRNDRDAHPDWTGFARHIERRFDAKSAPELRGAVCWLLGATDEIFPGREDIDASFDEQDTVWLSELIRATGNRMLQAVNFPTRPGPGFESIIACLIILENWAECDPSLKNILLKDVQ